MWPGLSELDDEKAEAMVGRNVPSSIFSQERILLFGNQLSLRAHRRRMGRKGDLLVGTRILFSCSSKMGLGKMWKIMLQLWAFVPLHAFPLSRISVAAIPNSTPASKRKTFLVQIAIPAEAEGKMLQEVSSLKTDNCKHQPQFGSRDTSQYSLNRYPSSILLNELPYYVSKRSVVLSTAVGGMNPILKQLFCRQE
nr:alpha,alpha-trehalose-phosphate synthase [UDP-forming] 5-like [Ipomoea batatas]